MLAFDDRQEAGRRIDEPDEVEPGQLRRDDPAMKRQRRAPRREQRRREKRKAQAVAGRTDDAIHLFPTSIDVLDSAAMEPADLGPHGDGAGAERRPEVRRHHRDLIEEAVRGSAEAVCGGILATREPYELGRKPVEQRPG